MSLIDDIRADVVSQFADWGETCTYTPAVSTGVEAFEFLGLPGDVEYGRMLERNICSDVMEGFLIQVSEFPAHGLEFPLVFPLDFGSRQLTNPTVVTMGQAGDRVTIDGVEWKVTVAQKDPSKSFWLLTLERNIRIMPI